MFKKICDFFKGCCVVDQEIVPAKPATVEKKAASTTKVEKPKSAAVKKTATAKKTTKTAVKKKAAAKPAATKKRTPKR